LVKARTLALKLEFHLFKKKRALLQRVVPARWQAHIRRTLRARYLVWDAAEYHAWLKRERPARRIRYSTALEQGLLAVLTPVWEGTPLKYFKILAQSIIEQNAAGAVEWVILDNGCQNRPLLNYLAKLGEHSWVNLVRSPTNAGIIGGLRLCLESASGRYVLPVDADDWLYPDCFQIVTCCVRTKGFPPLLYSDEDKLIGSQAVQPYLKPDFDPVLLLNSAYIAHLGVIDRQLALQYGAYTDKATEGSADWDLFARFLVAGHAAPHIPEVVYSWRMHPESTADDASSKPYIHSSQKAVLQRYLENSGLAAKFQVEYSPLLPGSADWWLRRLPIHPWPALLVSLETSSQAPPQSLDYPEIPRLSFPVRGALPSLAALIASQAEDDLVCLVADDLAVDRADWLWEAIGLFERFPDTGMIGGWIRNRAEVTMSAGNVFGFAGGCSSPDRGRPALDNGYFTQMRKQRSVSAVSSQFAVLRAGFLQDLLKEANAKASISMLGAWAGAYARRTGKRVIYSPFLSAVSEVDWDAPANPEEVAAFQSANADLIPDCRFYPTAFSLQAGQAYRLR
jgi:glycosyltransferase involved in cell wall biosynthesis